MLSGSLDALLRPVVEVQVRGSGGASAFTAIVDTGFTGGLAIPTLAIHRLGLPRHSGRISQFANGRFGVTYTYWGEVEWVNGWIGLEILEGQIDEAIVGAGLLRGYELFVDYGPKQA